MIDWAVLVAESAANLPKNEAKQGCSDSTGRNKPQISKKVGTADTRASTGSSRVVPTVPTVPTTFEWSRVDEHENRTHSAFIDAPGDGFEDLCAPNETTLKPTCDTCAHLCRPGLSDGLCGGRDDLPFAYTSGHPLRQLPANHGADCTAWVLHPFF